MVDWWVIDTWDGDGDRDQWGNLDYKVVMADKACGLWKEGKKLGFVCERVGKRYSLIRICVMIVCEGIMNGMIFLTESFNRYIYI